MRLKKKKSQKENAKHRLMICDSAWHCPEKDTSVQHSKPHFETWGCRHSCYIVPDSKCISVDELSLEESREKAIKEIWENIVYLERDLGVETDGHMTQILKFTIQCIANKYKIELGLNDDK
jgi:hypothetical protein